jgi:hypothetical protein
MGVELATWPPASTNIRKIPTMAEGRFWPMGFSRF